MKATYTEAGGGVNDRGWYVRYLVNTKTGRTVEVSRKRVAELRREGRIVEKCLCPSACDCQNPEPQNGAALISNECPEHNLTPQANPGCRAILHVNGALK